MNILQVNFSDLVGRAFNGYDLHLSLNEEGVNATQVVMDKRSNQDTVLELKKDIVLQHQLRQFEKKYSISNLVYPYGEEIIHLKEYQDADIVHYHIMHNGMVSLLDYPKLMNEKPSIWTIHDPWILTGNCVYPLTCEKWEMGCHDCKRIDEIYFEMQQDNTEFMWKVKKDILSQVNPHIIVSCGFMKKYIQESPLTKHFTKIHTIPFGINVEKYDISKKELIKRNAEINSEKVVLGFRCETAPIKGCTYIYEALRMIEDIRQMFEVYEYGWVNEEAMLIEFLLKCDIFLMPSLAETFGLMAIEAMAAGAVVISFKETVLEEITDAPNVGMAVEYESATGIADAIKELCNKPQERMNRMIKGYELVKNRYSYTKYVSRHKELYECILETE